MKEQSRAILPTEWGKFIFITFANEQDELMPHVVLLHPEYDSSKIVTVRIHSECMTGDLFKSQKCDCGTQLDVAMHLINKDKGCLIYLRQEGRGIGLINKIKAYHLQDQGEDTINANLHLGFGVDEREFSDAIKILLLLGIKNINLLTNNPEKVAAIEASDIKIHKRIPLIIDPNKDNYEYLKTKKDKMGHWL